ncbi:response regulator [Candidatus Saccharibacteria bacterium]|nr:response regulator [Candidatus Saccharibacteria bacterium]
MPKVAIIEDDKPIRDMYSMKLRAAGLEVAEANDGKDGLQLIREFKPDLVLLDLMMPVMSGQQMLRKLREQDWGRSTLVIVLTNLSQNEASMDLRLLRVEKYIVKAYSTPKQVSEMVIEILERYNKLLNPK